MSQIEWAMWANEQAVASGAIMLTGGVLGIAGMFHNWAFGIYSLIAGLFILVFEWPRGKRAKGTTMERQFQWPFTVVVDKFGIVGRNYFIRFVAYLLLCVPCCFILATVLGGVCLLITSIIYFLAAMKGEEWKPAGLDNDPSINKKRGKSLHPPKKPPPRAMTQESSAREVTPEAITMEIEEQGASNTQNAAPNWSAADKKPTRPPPRPRGAKREGIQTPSES